MKNFVCQQLEQEYKQQIIDFIHNISLTVDRYRRKYHIDTSVLNNEDIQKEEELISTTNRKRQTTIKTRSNKKQREISNVLYEIERCTKSQLLELLQLCKYKYGRVWLEPGTAIGAICAQSIGKPATQMTLKGLYYYLI